MEKALSVIVGVTFLPLCAFEYTMLADAGVCECVQEESSVFSWAMHTYRVSLLIFAYSGCYFPGVTGCAVLVDCCHCKTMRY